MSDASYDAIASLIIKLGQLTGQCNKVIATPRILTAGHPDQLLVGIIKDAQVLVNTNTFGLITNTLNRLKRECPYPIEVGTIKVSNYNGNAACYLVTDAGTIVFYYQPGLQDLLDEMINWGVAPKIVEKEVIKNVEVIKHVEVPAPKPTGFWAKLAYAFS